MGLGWLGNTLKCGLHRGWAFVRKLPTFRTRLPSEWAARCWAEKEVLRRSNACMIAEASSSERMGNAVMDEKPVTTPMGDSRLHLASEDWKKILSDWLVQCAKMNLEAILKRRRSWEQGRTGGMAVIFWRRIYPDRVNVRQY